MFYTTISPLRKKYYLLKALTNREQNKRASRRVVRIINKHIDEYILNYDLYKDEAVYKPATLFTTLYGINKPEIQKHYQMILNSKYTNNDAFYKSLVQKHINNTTSEMTAKQIEATYDTLKVISVVLDKYSEGFSKEGYEKNIARARKDANRYKILTENSFRKDVKISHKLPREVTGKRMRNLDMLCESMYRKTQLQAKYDLMEEENKYLELQGKDPRHIYKRWITTHEGRTTRHMGTNGQTVLIDEKFEVVHDVTGETDMMDRPYDPNILSGNTYPICYCDFECLDENLNPVL